MKQEKSSVPPKKSRGLFFFRFAINLGVVGFLTLPWAWATNLSEVWVATFSAALTYMFALQKRSRETESELTSNPQNENRRVSIVASLLCLLGSVWAIQPISQYIRSLYTNKYYNAMQKKDGELAMKYAVCAKRIAPSYATNDVELRIGYAKELANDYEGALKVYYNAYNAINKPDALIFNELRLLYKVGQRDRAFRGYCEAIDKRWLKDRPNGANYKMASIYSKTSILANFKQTLTMERMFEGKILSPFTDYSAFLNFVEEEFRLQGEPPERLEAMEFFRDVERNRDAVEQWLNVESESSVVKTMKATK